MIAISSRALKVIRQVTGHPRLKHTSGLRIARGDEGGERLRVGAVNEPAAGDQVVERDGARLYLGPVAAQKVRNGELDASTDENGRVTFILRDSA
ncbi:Fe-S cluster assembly protein HesB [Nocardioides bigeumensis]|uniref:Fe-S cluster assembly iron-binding protein IscA n=1 Tax=Nocardioides bigeumensis TaxID=433657 RepID=A0ABP5JBD2_9ACTN